MSAVVIAWVFLDRLVGVFVLPVLPAGQIPIQSALFVVGGPGLIWAACSVPAGALADRFSRERVAGTALFMAAGISFGTAWAPLQAFPWLRLLAATSEVAVLAAASAGVTASSTRRGAKVGVAFMGTRIASSVAAPGLAYGAHALGDWRLALIVNGAIACGLGGMLIWRSTVSSPAVRPVAGRTFSRRNTVDGLVAVPGVALVVALPALGSIPGSDFASPPLQFLFGLSAVISTLFGAMACDSRADYKVAQLLLACAAIGGLLVAIPVSATGLDALSGPFHALGVVMLGAGAGAIPLGLALMPTGGTPAEGHGSATAGPRIVAELAGGAVLAPVAVLLAETLHPAAAVLAIGFVCLLAYALVSQR